jgi:hypothetical protein
LTNGYTPNVGDSFRVLLFGSVSGNFGTENGLNLGGGLQLDPEYSSSGLTLVTTAVPPPPGGGASSSGGRHIPGLNHAPIPSVLPPSSNGAIPGPAGSLTNSGMMARESLDALFELLAGTVSNQRFPL